MPAQKAKSVLGKLGAKVGTAVAAHKDDPIQVGNMDLPAGINGVAQLVECKFDEYKTGANKGKLYFTATGIVKTPTEHNGMKVEGLRTNIQEIISDTPTRTRKTIDEHVAWICNAMKLLGGPEFLDDIDPENAGEALEEKAAALKAAAPHFYFKTYKFEKREKGHPQYNPQYDGPNAPEPRVQHGWLASCDEIAAESNGEVVDNTAAEEAVDEPQVEETSAEETTDLEALGAAADGGDDDAAAKLAELATAAGFSKKKIEGADSWAALAAEVAEKTGDGAEAVEAETVEEEIVEEEAERVVKKGEVFNYQPLDPTTKKPKINKAKKPVFISVEVLASDAAKKVVTIKDLDGGKAQYKNVPWDKLIDV